MPLQGDQILERGDVIELGGVDQAHKDIADVGAGEGTIKNKAFFRCKMAFFNARSEVLLSRGAPSTRRNRVSSVQRFCI